MDTYYNPEDLAKFGTIGEKAPELAEKFFSYYNAVFEEGALTAREKSLIALAVAHTVQCPYCFDAYTNGSKLRQIFRIVVSIHFISSLFLFWTAGPYIFFSA